MTKKSLIFLSIVVIMLFSAAKQAEAVCPNTTITGNTTFFTADGSCSGSYAVQAAVNSLTVTVQAGAGIAPPASTTALTINGINHTITNNGAITGTGNSSGNGIVLNTGANITSFSNNGLISTSTGTAIQLNGNSSIVGTAFSNTGTVNGGTGSALVLNGDSSISFSPIIIGDTTTYNGGITGLFTSGGTGPSATVILNTTASTVFNTGSSITNANNTASGAVVALSIDSAPSGSGGVINLGTISSSGTGTNAAAVRFKAEGTFTNSGTITGKIIDDGDDLNVTIINSGTISGGVVLNNGGTNTLKMLSGSITGGYTGGEGVDTLELNGGTITGAINLGAHITNFAVKDRIIVDGTFATGGAITATATDTDNNSVVQGDIDLTVGNSTVSNFTVNNTVNLGSGNIAVNSGSTLKIGTANLTSTGALSNSGTIMIAAGQSLTAGTMTAGALGALTIGVSPAAGANPASAGKLVLTGSPKTEGGFNTNGGVDLDGATIDVNVTGNSGFIPVGTTFTIIDANGALTGALPTSVTSDSILYKFALSSVGSPTNKDVLLTVTSSVGSVASNPNNANVANTMLNLGSVNDVSLNQIRQNLLNAPNEAAANNILESALPVVDGGAQQSALNVNNQVQGITEGRLQHIREGFNNPTSSVIRQNSFAPSLSQAIAPDRAGFSNASYNTVAADSDIRAMLGNNETRLSVADNVWLQGFGQKATQNTRNFVQGYDATTYGIIMGADTHEIFDSGTVGIAFNYGKAKVESKNANTARSNIDSYGVIVYGTHPVTETVFFDGQVGYNFNKIDSHRDNVGGTGLTAKADYGGNQYSARGLLGKDYLVGSGFTVTPTVSLAYTRLSVQGFTETGAEGANLKVNGMDYNILDLGLGVRAERLFTTASGTQLRPSVHAGYRYDVIGDKMQTTSTFTGGGPAFTTTGGEPQRGKFNIGGGIGVGTLNDWQLSAEYDYELQQEYSAHSGFIRASSPF